MNLNRIKAGLLGVHRFKEAFKIAIAVALGVVATSVRIVDVRPSSVGVYVRQHTQNLMTML